jgi:hypothetical protein
MQDSPRTTALIKIRQHTAQNKTAVYNHGIDGKTRLFLPGESRPRVAPEPVGLGSYLDLTPTFPLHSSLLNPSLFRHTVVYRSSLPQVLSCGCYPRFECSSSYTPVGDLHFFAYFGIYLTFNFIQ